MTLVAVERLRWLGLSEVGCGGSSGFGGLGRVEVWFLLKSLYASAQIRCAAGFGNDC